MTKPQIQELLRLSDGKQHTYGSARTRVQNNLVWAGLARYTDDAGNTITPSLTWKSAYEWCEITDAGKAVVATLKK